ncbi:large conductance mechanosensitive channel [Rhodopirellula rubra]|uniref:Large-conductance mechanosensitive channel n=1 Tax=Aporhodopirellula rubra TaxID=980271 RepID=A0A7W5E2J7_9BACT|nr:large conductance mechanosensitive channel protein MscL [Aporhodopirellula rubra]MBB3209051.1 large conductance mechanosensitive channel [Aporhodopirellula rubra]
MSLLKEFKEFAMKGSVVDLAVGVVIGGAFGKIVTSLVANVIMPPINLLTARFGINFKEAAYTIATESPKLKADGTMETLENGDPVMVMQDYPILNYGPFVQTVFEFLLIAAALFAVIKMINVARSKMESEPEEEKVTLPSEDILLLRDIRDSLKKD